MGLPISIWGSMTFLEKYQACETWHEKVIVMGLYHLAMSSRNKGWTLVKTAEDFGCSIGLVSENLKLAHAIHNNERLMKCSSRQEALKKLNGHH